MRHNIYFCLVLLSSFAKASSMTITCPATTTVKLDGGVPSGTGLTGTWAPTNFYVSFSKVSGYPATAYSGPKRLACYYSVGATSEKFYFTDIPANYVCTASSNVVTCNN